MKFALFYHSLVSDWNHGNAHFLRGITSELKARGHDVVVYEPSLGWSLRNLVRAQGERVIQEFHESFPHLESWPYDLKELDVEQAIDGADVVIAHEWNEPELIERLGQARKSGDHFRLLFHDTHHRMASNPGEMKDYDLSNYDGVLAFGSIIRDLYLERGMAERAWTWHEAADTRVFRPSAVDALEGDVVWIGNWGDGERAEELREFLLDPAVDLGLRTCVYGVRYPDEVLAALKSNGTHYAGWLPNYKAPEVFGRYCMTVHVPRRFYREKLPGIPTIRVFEALACGIPLVCAPWEDAENLFTPGEDYLVAKDGDEMRKHMRTILKDPEAVKKLSQHGLETIQKRHTCAHRVDELMDICSEIGAGNGTSLADLHHAKPDQLEAAS
jgi:spore maturation protein CgeB